MSPRWLAVFALCGGCYPWVSGSWDDYDTPDQVQVVGSAVLTERLGSYWADPDPEGDLWWGWLEEPQAGLSALELLVPDSPKCAWGEPDRDAILSLLGDPGAETSSLSGPATFEVPWNGNLGRFWSRTAEIAAGEYDLDPVSTDSAGTLQASPMFSMPPGVAVEGPPLSGRSPFDGAIEDFVFSWDPGTEAGEWFWLEARLSTLELSGYVPYEWVACLVPFDEGYVEIPPSLWRDAASAEAAYLFYGAVDERQEQVGQQEFTTSTVGLRRSAGILRL